MAYSRRHNGSWKPDWDRGNGWCETKPEWQDIDKSVDKTISLAELKDLWCPASLSVISITCEEIPGLSFELHVGLKEYHRETKRKRKPTSFGITYIFNGFIYLHPFVPLPGSNSDQVHHGAWHSKATWSQAVKTLTNEIYPSYVKEKQAVSLWGLASEQGIALPTLPEVGKDEAPTS